MTINYSLPLRWTPALLRKLPVVGVGVRLDRRHTAGFKTCNTAVKKARGVQHSDGKNYGVKTIKHVTRLSSEGSGLSRSVPVKLRHDARKERHELGLGSLAPTATTATTPSGTRAQYASTGAHTGAQVNWIWTDGGSTNSRGSGISTTTMHDRSQVHRWQLQSRVGRN